MNEVSFYPITLVSFANASKAWISWLNLAVLLGTLALALFNASKDVVARRFAYAYAFISIGVLVNTHNSALCNKPILIL
jgi:hypothetical protein